MASGHDLERVLNELGVELDGLTELEDGDDQLTKLESFILNGFSLSSDGYDVDFELVGAEVLTNDQVFFYLESKPMYFNYKLILTYNFLMHEYKEQQNKATIRYEDKQHTLTFLQNDFTKTLFIEPE